LHNRNICHRDIKPENILYCPRSREVKLVDFDISKKTFQKGSRRDMLTIIGTPFYQAPEMYIGGGYDEKVDLWALGVTIYKLVTGKTPF
jgi:calcium-dependent protein kinase